MSTHPIAWYRPPSENAPDGEAVYGPRDPNMPGMDTGWLPAYARGDDSPPEIFAQQIAAAMRFADAPLSHDQFVTLVLYLKARAS
jgi:hypothetical protein